MLREEIVSELATKGYGKNVTYDMDILFGNYSLLFLKDGIEIIPVRNDGNISFLYESISDFTIEEHDNFYTDAFAEIYINTTVTLLIYINEGTIINLQTTKHKDMA